MSVADTQTVIISNGEEFFEIPLADLDGARQDGFYLPHERGNTVVTNGQETLEIPLDVLADAESDGYSNLIPVPPDAARPRRKRTKKKSAKRGKRGTKVIPGLPASATLAGPVRISTGDDTAAIDVSGVAIATGEAEPERETAAVAIDTGEDEPSPLFDTGEIVIEEVIDEDAERRREIEERLEEAEALGERLKLLVALHKPSREEVERFGRTYGLSTLLHIVVLVILSFLVYQTAEKVDGGAIISSMMSTDDAVTDAAEVPQEVKIEQTDDAQTETANAADPAGALSNEIGAATDLSAFSGANVGGGLEGLAEALGKGVDKMTGEGEKTSASFFGAKQLASRFVFVIDNSLSMTKGRFETALNELAKTIIALNANQSYYIIFYSDAAYGLFHPQTYRDLIPATPRNKKLTIQWLLSVELCLRTDFAESLQISLFLEPDVIFVLGDGGFGDSPRVAQVMANRSESQKAITIHTLGMQLDARGVQNFKLLSGPTGGVYRDVGVHPLGAEMARQNPRKRNNVRGPIWGFKLPK